MKSETANTIGLGAIGMICSQVAEVELQDVEEIIQIGVQILIGLSTIISILKKRKEKDAN